MKRIFKFLKKISTVTATAVSAVTLLATSFAGITSVMQPVAVAAATPSTAKCTPQDARPETNIIYCGLAGGNDPIALMQSFQGYYSANSDANAANPTTHKDLQSVYNATATMSVGSFNSKMFQSGAWEVGTSYDNGTIKDNKGTVVATDVFISSRCAVIDNSSNANCKPSEISQGLYKPLNDASGKHITNVYYRDAKWFFDKDSSSKKTLIHINTTTNTVDFAMWAECGNALIFKPVTPKQSLVCTQLTLDQDKTNSALYHFTATATEENQTNGKMFIDFGDKTNSQTVTVNQSTVTLKADHIYSQAALQNPITINVAIGVNGFTTPGGLCQKQIVPQTKLTFACKQLTATEISSANGSRTYKLVANVQGTDKVSTYQFFFTGSNPTAPGSVDNTIHTFTFNANETQTLVGYFVATSATGLKTDQNDANCQFRFTTELPNTGPASTFSIFAGMSVLGVILHQFIIRRKALGL